MGGTPLLWKEAEGLRWITFDLFEDCPKLVHGVFSRDGGVSEAPYGSLNVGDGLGDDEKRVAENRKRVQEALKVPKLVYAEQVHKTKIAQVSPFSPDKFQGTDAFMTNNAGVGTLIKHADCQAAIFYDPTRHVLATAHAGWRGSVQNIYAKVIDQLKTTYRCRPENLLVAISPSLGPDNAEFVNFREELPEALWEHEKEANHFDFWEISERQLIEAHVLPDHIEIAQVCTYASEADFFSYRRNETTGRNGTVAALL